MLWVIYCLFSSLFWLFSKLKKFSTLVYFEAYICIWETLNLLMCEEFTCHLSPVTCHLSPVTCHLSPVTCHLSPLTCVLSPLTSHLSPVTRHITPITCHLSPATSHLSPGKSQKGHQPQPQALHLLTPSL